MNNTNFVSEKLKGRGFSSAPLINNYNKSINTKEEQNGRSMIEMLGVLAIIGVLSVGGIAGYSKAMMKYRINKAIEQITLIAGNARTFFGQQGDYTGIDCMCYDSTTYCASGYDGDLIEDGCPIIKKAKIVPDEMLTLDSTGNKITAITGVFGSQVFLMSGTKGKFVIDYDIVPQEACIELASYDWRPIGAKFVTAVGQKYGDQSAKLPLSLETAVELCTIGDNDNFEFILDIGDNVDCQGCIRIDLDD